jgi:hypothetical protein
MNASTDPMILSVTDHRQNPVDSTKAMCSDRFASDRYSGPTRPPPLTIAASSDKLWNVLSNKTDSRMETVDGLFLFLDTQTGFS